MISSGKLRHRVVIEKDDGTTVNDHNEPVEGWQWYAEAWASIEPMGGQERWRAQQVKATISHKIIMRFIEGVTEKMRIKFDQRTFDIEAVLNARERDRKLIVFASERV